MIAGVRLYHHGMLLGCGYNQTQPHGHAQYWQARVLTMHMRHLYRSPLRICFSSSRMRAFSASSVVAVESSVILKVKKKIKNES